jgi:hypothetical protein
MSVMANPFLDAVHRAMEPLTKRFGLRVIEESETTTIADVLYANDTTAVRITVDWGEWRPFVRLYRLEKGQLPLAASIALPAGDKLKEFDADDLLILRASDPSPVGKMFGQRSAEGALPLLNTYAAALERSAVDVLTGDFSIFSTMEDEVRKRYRP